MTLGNAVKLVLSSLLMLLGLAGCASGGAPRPFSEESIHWPAPPEMSRIAFLGQFSNKADLGIKESVWAKMMSFAVGPNVSEMLRPMDVAVGADGDVIFVADPDASCVHRYDLRRSRYHCLTTGSKDQAIAPVAVAISREGWLYASDAKSGQVLRMQPNGRYLEPFSTTLQLQQPTGLFWDDNAKRLFVADTGAQTIHVFHQDGRHEYSIGERGAEPGLFNFPTYIWLDRGQDLLVTDTLNFRLQRFNNGGEFLSEFGENGDEPGDFSRPKGVATDSHGHIYVIDGLMHTIQIFNSDGELLIAIGGQGQREGQFWLPNGLYISKDNMIFVADAYNKRVQVFRYVGHDQ